MSSGLGKVSGGVQGGNWVAQLVDLDKAAEFLSKKVSSVFSSIYKTCIKPLMACFQQGNQSIGCQVDSSPSGTTVDRATATRGMTGTAKNQPAAQKSASTYEYEVSGLMDKLAEARRDHGSAWDKVNSYEDAEHYDILGKSEKVDSYRELLQSKEKEFEAKYPNEYQAFKSKLAEKEAQRQQATSFVTVPLTGLDQGTPTIVHSSLEDSSSDQEWWGEQRDELDNLVEEGKKFFGFSSERVNVSDSENGEWW